MTSADRGTGRYKSRCKTWNMWITTDVTNVHKSAREKERKRWITSAMISVVSLLGNRALRTNMRWHPCRWDELTSVWSKEKKMTGTSLRDSSGRFQSQTHWSEGRERQLEGFAGTGAGCWSLYLLAVQPQPVDALSGITDHRAHTWRQTQWAHNSVQLC